MSDFGNVDQGVPRWLADRALPGRRIVPTRQLTGGFRNDNLLLVTYTGQRYVLRRYRHGDRHAVEAALAHRLTGVVPVPEVLAVDSGTAVTPGDLRLAAEPAASGGEQPGLEPGARVQLLHDPAGTAMHRAQTDAELTGDRLILQPRAQQ